MDYDYTPKYNIPTIAMCHLSIYAYLNINTYMCIDLKYEKITH